MAARHLLAALRVCDALLPERVPRKLRRSVASRLHEFRRLRDVQVMLARIAPLMDQAPVWARFHGRLAAEQARARSALRTHLRKAEVEGERLRLHDLQRLLMARARSAPADSLLATLHAMASDAQQRTARRLGRMNPAKPGTLHRTRLAIKRARYILELIAEVESAPWAKAAHRAARAWQDQLGTIQDLRVLDLELAALRSKDPADVAAVMWFRADLVTERNDAIVRFVAQRAELEAFVRQLAPAAHSQAPADPSAETA